MTFDDSTSMTITCPACGRQIYETVGWFKRPGQSCPHCGTAFDSDAFRTGFAEVEKQLSAGIAKAEQQLSEGLTRAGKQLSDALRKLGDLKIDLKL